MTTTETSFPSPSDLSLLQLFFSFRGRIDRTTYYGVGFPLVMFGALVALGSIVGFGSALRGEPLPAGARPASDLIVPALWIATAIFVAWANMALTVKRLHDRNRPAWLTVALMFVPLISLWVALESVLAGSEGANSYGDGPRSLGRLLPGPQRTTTRFALSAIGIAVPLAMAPLIRSFLFQPFSIPTASGVPTLLPGDDFFVSKFAYKPAGSAFQPLGVLFGGTPARGDVVVFHLPRDQSVSYVKRIIGLPGDKVQMTEGQLYLNGTVVPRQQIADYPVDDRGRIRPVHQYVETLPGGRSYAVLQDGKDGPLDNTVEFTVPDGHVFTIGDNRSNSMDSRALAAVGYIPLENLIGRVECRYFSTGSSLFDLRLNRMMTMVR